MNHTNKNNHHGTQNTTGAVDLPEPYQPASKPVQVNRANDMADTQEFYVDLNDAYDWDEPDEMEDCFGYGDRI